MSVVSELMALPGAIAAGEYSFRGDRFTHEGQLNDEMAKMASIMCRATTMGVHMEAAMLGDFCESDCGLVPAKGWAVQGPQFTVCVYANIFCFFATEHADLNKAMNLLQTELQDFSADLI